MTITRDPKLTPGVNHVIITLTSGVVTRSLQTTYNQNQEEFCINRTAKRLKITNVKHAKIEKI